MPPPCKILDLGTENLLSEMMREAGYEVTNTKGENLDLDFKIAAESNADLITAFEIFEHMLAPFNILNAINTVPNLIASVPLKLWFSNAYWNEKDDWDKHYHEFEIKQFKLLLNRSNWEIIEFEKWKSYDPKKIGLRPVLRRFSYRYYIVYCQKISKS